MSWGRRKDNNQAYQKTEKKGIRGTSTSPVSDIHLKEQRLKADVRNGWRQSDHMFNLDDIDYGKTVLEKMETIFQQQFPDLSIIDELNGQDERVRDGVLEVLGRDADKIEQFIDFRLSNENNMENPKWVMAIPFYGSKNDSGFRAEDSLAGMFQTDGYKHKLRIAEISPRKFLDDWAAPKIHTTYDREVIEKIKKSLLAKKPVETPFITVDEKTGKIESHEGRHRATAASELGIDSIPVWVVSRNSIDEMTAKEKETFFSDNYIRQDY